MPKIECTTLGYVPDEGLATMRIPKDGWAIISQWLVDNGKDPEETVRSFAMQPDGSVSFQCGGGYNVTDTDILGGDGTGRTERKFNDETGYFVTRI